MRKMLMIASVPSMIGQFNMSNIKILLRNDYDVNVACNWNDRSVWPGERVITLKKDLADLNVKTIQIDFSRSPLDVKRHKKAYSQLKNLLQKENYDLLHCHAPIASAIVRLAAHKAGSVRVIYTAHGFHFYKGASIINWMIYYPIEKYLSKYTDTLITINREDYNRALRKLKCKDIVYIPGIGLDLEKYKGTLTDTWEKRKEIGVGRNKFLILSVGEINDNKNHQVIIRALAKLNNVDMVYVIVGKGEKRTELEELCKKLHVDGQVIFLGYRDDVKEVLQCADIFAFPSKREGLGLASLEAMAYGIPLLTSDVHGIRDYSINGKSGFSCRSSDVDGFAEGIMRLYKDKEQRVQMGKYNRDNVRNFDVHITEQIMEKVYNSQC